MIELSYVRLFSAIIHNLALLVGVPALIVWVATRNWPPAKENQ